MMSQEEYETSDQLCRDFDEELDLKIRFVEKLLGLLGINHDE